MHVTSTRNVTHDAAERKRGGGARDASGLMAGFAGTSVHDDLAVVCRNSWLMGTFGEALNRNPTIY